MHFGSDNILMFMVFAIPIVAIVMGVAHRIVQTLAEQRTLELAQRERIAAIERGIDPSKLPPLPSPQADALRAALSHSSTTPNMYRRAQGLLIGGLVTLAAGAGVCVMIYVLQPDDRSWAAGLVPAFIGVALLVSAAIVWPRGGRGPAA
jgi:uncharacterized protein DUF6249